MLDTNSCGSWFLRHDAETFQVAEELIMLSSQAASATSMNVNPNSSPSNISGFFEHTITREKRASKVTRCASTALVTQGKTKTRSSRGTAHKSRTQNDIKKEDIINSRCDVSHLELLKEHRVRFRRVHRLWNVEQRTKKQQYLARFYVQGIPLVQHLETFNHWR